PKDDVYQSRTRSPSREATSIPGRLTAREISVTQLVADGHTDREIARRLAISERTAESHVLRVREKLGLRSRVELGRWGAEHLTAKPLSGGARQDVGEVADTGCPSPSPKRTAVRLPGRNDAPSRGQQTRLASRNAA